MYYYLNGILAYNDGAVSVIDCNGVGYKCYISLNSSKSLGAVGDKVKLFTYLSVKEDSLDLYGFATESEQQAFVMLISVSGVGPKAAMSILSALKPDDLMLAISAQDYKILTSAQGVGPKLAQRIVLELKDKVTNKAFGDLSSIVVNGKKTSSSFEAAIEGLCALGYTRSEAMSALSKENRDLPEEELIKNGLKTLMRD